MSKNISRKRLVPLVFKSRARTLIEMIIVCSIIFLIAGTVTIPQILRSRLTVEYGICAHNRKTIQDAEISFFAAESVHSSNIQDLVDKGYLSSNLQCPTHGVYAWVPYNQNDSNYQTIIACSLHGENKVEEGQLTSLGSTFSEITSGFANLIRNFYKQNGRYQKKNTNKGLIELGLDPGEWSQSYNGLLYKPRGKNLYVYADFGYTINVKDLKGRNRKVKKKRKIIYSVPNDSWYYQNTKSRNKIDINSLKVLKNKNREVSKHGK